MYKFADNYGAETRLWRVNQINMVKVVGRCDFSLELDGMKGFKICG